MDNSLSEFRHGFWDDDKSRFAKHLGDRHRRCHRAFATEIDAGRLWCVEWQMDAELKSKLMPEFTDKNPITDICCPEWATRR